MKYGDLIEEITWTELSNLTISTGFPCGVLTFDMEVYGEQEQDSITPN
jgi:hypothetical protein